MIDKLIFKLKSLPPTTKFLFGGGSVMAGVLAGLNPLFITLLILILFDLGTGVYAAKKSQTKITSHGLRKTVEKTLSYFSIIIICVLVDVYLLSTFSTCQFVTAFIGFVELYSIFENIGVITGRDFASAFQSFFTDVFKKFGKTKPKE